MAPGQPASDGHTDEGTSVDFDDSDLVIESLTVYREIVPTDVLAHEQSTEPVWEVVFTAEEEDVDADYRASQPASCSGVQEAARADGALHQATRQPVEVDRGLRNIQALGDPVGGDEQGKLGVDVDKQKLADEVEKDMMATGESAQSLAIGGENAGGSFIRPTLTRRQTEVRFHTDSLSAELCPLIDHTSFYQGKDTLRQPSPKFSPDHSADLKSPMKHQFSQKIASSSTKKLDISSDEGTDMETSLNRADADFIQNHDPSWDGDLSRNTHESSLFPTVMVRGRVAGLQSHGGYSIVQIQLAQQANSDGWRWLEEGRPEEAVKLFTAALDQVPGHIELLANRAVALMELDRYPEAVHDAQKCIQMQPDQPKSRLLLGTLYLGMKDVASALSVLEEGHKLFPEEVGFSSQLERAFAMLAAQHEDVGLSESAEVSVLDETESSLRLNDAEDGGDAFMEVGMRERDRDLYGHLEQRIEPAHDRIREKTDEVMENLVAMVQEKILEMSENAGIVDNGMDNLVTAASENGERGNEVVQVMENFGEKILEDSAHKNVTVDVDMDMLVEQQLNDMMGDASSQVDAQSVDEEVLMPNELSSPQRGDEGKGDNVFVVAEASFAADVEKKVDAEVFDGDNESSQDAADVLKKEEVEWEQKGENAACADEQIVGDPVIVQEMGEKLIVENGGDISTAAPRGNSFRDRNDIVERVECEDGVPDEDVDQVRQSQNSSFGKSTDDATREDIDDDGGGGVWLRSGSFHGLSGAPAGQVESNKMDVDDGENAGSAGQSTHTPGDKSFAYQDDDLMAATQMLSIEEYVLSAQPVDGEMGEFVQNDRVVASTGLYDSENAPSRDSPISSLEHSSTHISQINSDEQHLSQGSPSIAHRPRSHSLDPQSVSVEVVPLVRERPHSSLPRRSSSVVQNNDGGRGLAVNAVLQSRSQKALLSNEQLGGHWQDHAEHVTESPPARQGSLRRGGSSVIDVGVAEGGAAGMRRSGSKVAKNAQETNCAVSRLKGDIAEVQHHSIQRSGSGYGVSCSRMGGSDRSGESSSQLQTDGKPEHIIGGTHTGPRTPRLHRIDMQQRSAAHRKQVWVDKDKNVDDVEQRKAARPGSSGAVRGAHCTVAAAPSFFSPIPQTPPGKTDNTPLGDLPQKGRDQHEKQGVQGRFVSPYMSPPTRPSSVDTYFSTPGDSGGYIAMVERRRAGKSQSHVATPERGGSIGSLPFSGKSRSHVTTPERGGSIGSLPFSVEESATIRSNIVSPDGSRRVPVWMHAMDHSHTGDALGSRGMSRWWWTENADLKFPARWEGGGEMDVEMGKIMLCWNKRDVHRVQKSTGLNHLDAVAVLNLFDWSVAKALRAYGEDPVQVFLLASQRFAHIRQEATAKITSFRKALAGDSNLPDKTLPIHHKKRVRHTSRPASLASALISKRAPPDPMRARSRERARAGAPTPSHSHPKTAAGRDHQRGLLKVRQVVEDLNVREIQRVWRGHRERFFFDRMRQIKDMEARLSVAVVTLQRSKQPPSSLSCKSTPSSDPAVEGPGGTREVMKHDFQTLSRGYWESLKKAGHLCGDNRLRFAKTLAMWEVRYVTYLREVVVAITRGGWGGSDQVEHELKLLSKPPPACVLDEKKGKESNGKEKVKGKAATRATTVRKKEGRSVGRKGGSVKHMDFTLVDPLVTIKSRVHAPVEVVRVLAEAQRRREEMRSADDPDSSYVVGDADSHMEFLNRWGIGSGESLASESRAERRAFSAGMSWLSSVGSSWNAGKEPLRVSSARVVEEREGGGRAGNVGRLREMRRSWGLGVKSAPAGGRRDDAVAPMRWSGGGSVNGRGEDEGSTVEVSVGRAWEGMERFVRANDEDDTEDVEKKGDQGAALDASTELLQDDELDSIVTDVGGDR